MLNKPNTLKISILVSPDYVGSGIGSQMMQLNFDDFGNHSSEEYLARIHKDNIRSQKFFMKHHFVILNEDDNFLIFRREVTDD